MHTKLYMYCRSPPPVRKYDKGVTHPPSESEREVRLPEMAVGLELRSLEVRCLSYRFGIRSAGILSKLYF